jgi:hypothetical protein
MVFVALAGIGGTPVKSSAGNAMKLPPPATAFSAPPRIPAMSRRRALCGIKNHYHMLGSGLSALASVVFIL